MINSMGKKNFFVNVVVATCVVVLMAFLYFVIIGSESFIGTYYFCEDTKPMIQLKFDYTNKLEYKVYTYESEDSVSSLTYYGTWQYQVTISKAEPEQNNKVHTIDCRYIDPFRNNRSVQMQFFYVDGKLISYTDNSVVLEKE